MRDDSAGLYSTLRLNHTTSPHKLWGLFFKDKLSHGKVISLRFYDDVLCRKRGGKFKVRQIYIYIYIYINITNEHLSTFNILHAWSEVFIKLYGYK